MQFNTLTAASLAMISFAAANCPGGSPRAILQYYSDDYTTPNGTFEAILNTIAPVPGSFAPTQTRSLLLGQELTSNTYEPTIKYTIIGATRQPVESISCRAYKDGQAQQPGSAEFTFANPALISTPGNPVTLGSVLCFSSEEACIPGGN